VNSNRRAYAAVVGLITAFIVYGSLFPFIWYYRPGWPLGYLLRTWQDWDHRGDLLANILLYMPFGFFLVAALDRNWPPAQRFVTAIAAATALSCCMELAQYHDAGRTTSMGDVYANVIGTAAGAVGALLFAASIRWPLLKEAAAHPVPAVLIVMWAGSDLFPYVPMIDLHKYWHAVRPLLDLPVLPLTDVLVAVTIWAFLGFILISLYGFWRFLLLFPLLVAAETAAKILILDNILTHANLLGAAAAYVGWIVLHRMPGRVTLLTMALAAVVLHQRLSPFVFSGPATAYDWRPFQDLMVDPQAPAIPLFCQKFFLIGGLIWLIGRCGLPLAWATALTTVILFGTSWAQTRIPGQSGHITEPVLALVLGGAFSALRTAAAHRRDAMAAELTPIAKPPAGRYAPYVPPHLR
jgi:VanZ family protein